jgi:uncharacterized Tic20 family protein
MDTPPPINVASNDPEERSMAALAHGSIVLNFFLPGLGVVAALAVWLIQRDRSAFAARHARQATAFQIAWMVIPLVMVIAGALIGLVGFVTLAVADAAPAWLFLSFLVFGGLALAAITIVGLLYALVGAYEASQGRDFHYWLIGNIVR